jgi:hypothetical protein
MFASETFTTARMTSLNNSAALSLYNQARLRGRLHRWLAALTGRPAGLRPLASAAAVEGSFAGLQEVPIGSIQGSEGRTTDFDQDFNPLRDTTMGRWLSILKARVAGQDLPPVDLVKVGGTYYVRDGHHRISVARALGEQYITATVRQLQ